MQLILWTEIRLAKRSSPKLYFRSLSFSTLALKDDIKRFAARHAPLEKGMYWFYKLKNGSAAEREIEERKKTSIFDYQKLSAEIPYGPEERVIDNNLYGYAQALKRFADITSDLHAYMEHGLFLGGIVHKDQHHWHFPKIITMSQHRVGTLQEKLPQKEAIAVGPYIHYAKPLLSDEEMKTLKVELGKVLLVFPFHSMKGVQANFAEDAFIREIKKVAEDYDSVLISLYYLDAQNEARAQAYLDQGFRVVTAGHRFDRHFADRQRTHIELADMTMSNGMGTQTGFCVYLNKPHYIFKQEHKQVAKNSLQEKRFRGSSGASEKEKVAFQRNYFAQLFGSYQTKISEEQREAVSEFWGFEDVKTKEELRGIFQH